MEIDDRKAPGMTSDQLLDHAERLVQGDAERTRLLANIRGVVHDKIELGIIVVGPSGRILDANDFAGRLTQWTPAELRQNTLDLILPQKVLEHHQHNLESYFRNPTTRRMSNRSNLQMLRRDKVLVGVKIELTSDVVENYGIIGIAFIQPADIDG